MLKKLLIGLAILAGMSGPVYGAGTIPGFSLAQQIGSNGVPLVGCKLYIIQAGTTSTPQNGYSDSGLTLPLSNPVICDGYGRLPQIFVADGNIKVRLTTAGGGPILTQDGILVIGASSGGGGGSPVDPTTILATGDMKVRYGVDNLTGFVRANGRTIGSAASGATERANADCQSLYEYLWSFSDLVVSGGRGANANADWTANKTLALPDWRGRAIGGLDDMGNTAAGRLTATYFGATATTLGAAGGAESHTMTVAEIAAHFHTTTISDPGHTHSSNAVANNGTAIIGAANFAQPTYGIGATINSAFTGIRPNSPNGLDTTYSAGSSTPFAIASPMKLTTIYLKL